MVSVCVMSATIVMVVKQQRPQQQRPQQQRPQQKRPQQQQQQQWNQIGQIQNVQLSFAH